MEITETGSPGLLIIKPKIFEDQRGYFFESYNQQQLMNRGIDCHFVQDNQSKSVFGVIRGLHYQLNPFAQTKLIRVLEGKILDIALDIRSNSPTYKKWYGIELSERNKLQLLIPKGFAHGFSVLSKTAVISYKCDSFYHPASERGIHSLDPDLNIDWQLKSSEIVLSERDAALPLFVNAEMNFEY